MRRINVILLLLGLLLVAAPFSRQFTARASEEEYDEDDGFDEEEEEEASADSVEDPDTVVLNDSNFDGIVNGSHYALVEFYAPSCGHCMSLAPHYAKASTLLKDYEPKVLIAKVDASKNRALAEKFSIQGFPTIIWFVDGEVVGDYGGGRTTDEIVAWIKKRSGPAVKTVGSAEALAEWEKQSEVVFLGLFQAFEGPEYALFEAVAKKSDGSVFAQTTDAKLAEAAGLSQPGFAAIKNIKGEERDVSVYSGPYEEEGIKEWVEAEKMPLTIEFSDATAQRIFNSGVATQIIFWSKASDFEPEAPEFKALREAAKELKGKMFFVTSNNENESSKAITDYFKLDTAAAPVVLGFQMEGNQKYKFHGDFTKSDLVAFARSVLDGSAPADYKSAPVPEEPTEEGVTVVVGTSFNQIVLDPSKDVFLEVYAPWCGHCKSLAPIWSQLAEHFAPVDSVVIAKMDGTDNDHPSIAVKSYPTLLFFPAGSEDADEAPVPVPFEGSRDFEALVEFVKLHATVPFDPPVAGSTEEEGSKDEL